jgi:tetratricopeptide (TPR) repeat protein
MAAAVTLAAPLASAQDQAPQTADELRRLGNDLVDQGRAAEAVPVYQRAYEQSKEPALHYNLGRAYMALGDYPNALTRLEAFRAEASAELQAKVPSVPGLIEELKGKVSMLEITCTEPGAVVRLREQVLGTTPIAATRVVAGTAHLAVSKNGFITVEQQVELPGGSGQRVEITLVREPPKRTVVIAPAKQDTKTVGYVVGGVGVGMLAVSGAFAYLAYAQGQDANCPAPCPRGTIIDAQGTTLPNPAYESALQAHDKSLTFAHISTGAFALGLAGVAVGTYFLFRPSKAAAVTSSWAGPMVRF